MSDMWARVFRAPRSKRGAFPRSALQNPEDTKITTMYPLPTTHRGRHLIPGAASPLPDIGRSEGPQ